MDLRNSIQKRRSIRTYQSKPIPQEVLEEIIDAARFAPTARAVEPWEFVIVRKPERLTEIAHHAVNGKFIAEAAACIAVFCKDTKYYLEDGCAAVENMLLAATSLGVGTCWVAGDKKDYCSDISALLLAPHECKLVALISCGYPQSPKEFRSIKRRAVADILHWEEFERSTP
ncbi:MAG: nitroreductase family protein [Candidatus Omnitrophica bacterium]|nr:nitroreductase family protein [Candidatus Omnitrophota bacterium]